MFHTRTLVAYLVVQFGGMESYTEKTPDSAVCNSREEASVIRFAHSIKKFTDTCVTDGYPNCEDQTCRKMLETFINDNCHTMVLKCASDPSCAFHSQAVPYKNYIGGTATTCSSCISNPKEALDKMEATTKRAAAVCKFELVDEPQSHAQCQTHECHEAMKSVNLKCLSGWVRGFSWLPDATDDCKMRISAYTKASITCDPSEAKVQFASASSLAPLTQSPTGELQKYMSSVAPNSAIAKPAATSATGMPTVAQSSPAAVLAPAGAAVFLVVLMAELVAVFC